METEDSKKFLEDIFPRWFEFKSEEDLEKYIRSILENSRIPLDILVETSLRSVVVKGVNPYNGGLRKGFEIVK